MREPTDAERLHQHPSYPAPCLQILDALRTLVQSLDWEAKRSGTTYNGYEKAKDALRELEDR